MKTFFKKLFYNLKKFRGSLALIIITTLACCFGLVRGLLMLADHASKLILALLAIPFMLVAFLLEPSMTKSSVKDLIKIAQTK